MVDPKESFPKSDSMSHYFKSDHIYFDIYLLSLSFFIGNDEAIFCIFFAFLHTSTDKLP